jgi:VanZ family protein
MLTSVLCTLPNFHPEHYLGTGYHWWLDMMIHGGYYFLLSLILFTFYNKDRKTAYFFLAILVLSYILEFVQIMVPGRSFSALDFLSNTIGVGLAWSVCFVRSGLRSISRE